MMRMSMSGGAGGGVGVGSSSRVMRTSMSGGAGGGSGGGAPAVAAGGGGGGGAKPNNKYANAFIQVCEVWVCVWGVYLVGGDMIGQPHQLHCDHSVAQFPPQVTYVCISPLFPTLGPGQRRVTVSSSANGDQPRRPRTDHQRGVELMIGNGDMWNAVFGVPFCVNMKGHRSSPKL